MPADLPGRLAGWLLAALLIGAVAAFLLGVVRVLATRRVLAGRGRLVVLPTDDLDLSPTDASRADAAAGEAHRLARSRPTVRGFLSRWGQAVGFELAGTPDGRMVHTVSGSERALGLLGVPGFPGVELRAADDPDVAELLVPPAPSLPNRGRRVYTVEVDRDRPSRSPREET